MTDKALITIRIIFTLALIASLCALAVGDANAIMQVKLVQARGGLNVRKAPGIESQPVYLLEDCETVVVLGEQDGWVLVGKNTPPHGAIGWVCGDYLK